MSETHKTRTASDAEIRQIIESIATASRQKDGYFLPSEVPSALKAIGINPKRVDWRKILGSMYHTDFLASTTRIKPYNANDPVIISNPTDIMLGAPDLGIGPASINTIDASYRHDGKKIHGISPQPPKDLRTHD